MKTTAQIAAGIFVAEMLKRNRLHDYVHFSEHRGTSSNIICAECFKSPEFNYAIVTNEITLEEYRAAVLAEIEKEKQKL